MWTNVELYLNHYSHPVFTQGLFLSRVDKVRR